MITGGIGHIVGGEGHVAFLPGNWRPGRGGMGVIFCHGANAPYSDAAKILGQRRVMLALAKAGFAVIAPDLGGTQTWGNDTSITRVGQARTYLQETLGADPGRIVLGGASMGGFVSCNYARQNLEDIACWFGIIPARDLSDFHTRNPLGSTALINAAYGGAYDEATMGPTHNPANYVEAGDLDGLPMHSWYAGSDTVCLPSIELDFAAVQGSCEATNLGDQYDHATAGVQEAVPADDVVQFVLETVA